MDVTFHVDDAYVNDVLDKLDALADEGQISGIQTCEQFMFAPWNYEKVLYDVEDKLSKANEDYPGILDDFSAEDVTLDVLEAMDNELNSNRNIDADGMTPYEKILDDRIHEYREKECVLNEARETMDMKQVSPLRQREILDRLKKQDRYALLRAQATDVEEDFADETGLMLCQAASSLSSTLGAAQQNQYAENFGYEKDTLDLEEQLAYLREYVVKGWQDNMQDLSDRVFAFTSTPEQELDGVVAQVYECVPKKDTKAFMAGLRQFTQELSSLPTETTGAYLAAFYKAAQELAPKVPEAFKGYSVENGMHQIQHAFAVAKKNLTGFDELSKGVDASLAKSQQAEQAK